MAAPDTNIKTQKRRHRGLLIGIALGMLLGVTLMLFWFFEDVAKANDPQSGAPPSEGRKSPDGGAREGTLSDVQPEPEPSGEQASTPSRPDPSTPSTLQ